MDEAGVGAGRDAGVEVTADAETGTGTGTGLGVGVITLAGTKGLCGGGSAVSSGTWTNLLLLSGT